MESALLDSFKCLKFYYGVLSGYSCQSPIATQCWNPDYRLSMTIVFSSIAVFSFYYSLHLGLNNLKVAAQEFQLDLHLVGGYERVLLS